MKFIDGRTPTLELTRRNLEILLAKLDDPSSVATLGDPSGRVFVRAVQNDEHYKNENRVPGPMWMRGEIA